MKGKQLGVNVFIFLIFLTIYCVLGTILPERANDMFGHATVAKEMMLGIRPTNGNFLMYWLAIIFSFFSHDITRIIYSICFLLASATFLRFYISKQIIYKIDLYAGNEKKNYWFSLIMAVSLIFVFVIPLLSYLKYDEFYMGNFAANVWHNSTIIFVFPFAILLYLVSCRQLENYRMKRDLLLLILIVINVLIKPSFLFVFVFIYPVVMLAKYRFSKSFWLSLLPILGCGVLILLMYWMIYITNNNTVEAGEESRIVFAPFRAYKIYRNYLDFPICLILSIFFPLIYSIWNYKKLKGDRIYWYTVFLLIPALLIYMLLVEEGPRFYHGILYWQIVVCVWLYFFVSLIRLIKDIKIEGYILRNKILLSFYSLHVLIGIIYLIRIIKTLGYA